MSSRNGDAFKCPLCSKSYIYVKAFENHLDLHDETDKICGDCGELMSCKEAVMFHALQHAKELLTSYPLKLKIFKCRDCDEMMTDERKFENHKAEHESQELFKCDLCKESYIGKQSFSDHLSNHAKEKGPYCWALYLMKIKCQFCRVTFTARQFLHSHCLSKHPKEYKGIPCRFCGTRFMKVDELTCHEEHMHENDQNFKVENESTELQFAPEKSLDLSDDSDSESGST